MELSRAQALRFRWRQQELAAEGRVAGRVLDLGVQDTGGPRAAQWALALRGVEMDDADLVYAWTLRGAPHAYRRSEIAEVAAATTPYDEADAAKRIFDAAKPLKAAGIPVLEALATVARCMRDIVREPTVKGELSTALTARLPAPYLRACRPCQATHVHEQPFRLAALQAGLELAPQTSPPILRRITGWQGPSATVSEYLDVVRGALHLLGPTTPKFVAEYLDAPVRSVRGHWPEDTCDVVVDGERRQVLAAHAEQLHDPTDVHGVRLLGAFDPWLQARDRALLVPDTARRRQLWPVLGRPGAVLAGTEVIGTWRPRSHGKRLRLQIDGWTGQDLGIELVEQAERLAEHRGQHFDGFTDR